MTLNLGVDKGPQNVRCERQVDVDELCLLMQAVQGEVIPQLHGYDGVFLLKEEELSDQEEGGRKEKQEKTAFLPIPAIQTHTKTLKRQFLNLFDMTGIALSIIQTAASQLLQMTCCLRASNKC